MCPTGNDDGSTAEALQMDYGFQGPRRRRAIRQDPIEDQWQGEIKSMKVFSVEWEPLMKSPDPALTLDSILESQSYNQTTLSEKPIVRIIFTRAKKMASPGLYVALQEKFGISRQFFREKVDGMSSIFGCELEGGRSPSPSYRTWSRFLFKRRESTSSPWLWMWMSISVNWCPEKKKLVIYADVPNSMRNAIVQGIEEDLSAALLDPFRIHLVLIKQALDTANGTIWDLLDCVGEIEAKRQNGLITSKSLDYHVMHDLARHIIHSNEMLDAAVDTICQIGEEHGYYFKTEVYSGEAQTLSRQTAKMLRYHEEFLKRLRLRSYTLDKRLTNEINLALNLVAQETGKAALADAAQMKTISLVTLIFLPATTISTIFGMNFFEFDSSSNSFFVSRHFWIFWIFAIPLTAGFFALWYWLNGWNLNIVPTYILRLYWSVFGMGKKDAGRG